MLNKSFRSEPGLLLATTDADQTLQQLRQLMCMIDKSLPTLPPQFDVLLGNALLNLALMRLIAMHGQVGAANLLAASAEALWSAACEQAIVTTPATVLNA